MGNLHIFIKPYFTHKTVPLNPTKKGMSPTNSSGQILFGEDDLDEVDFLKEIFESINPGYSLLFVNSGKKLIASLAGMEDRRIATEDARDVGRVGQPDQRTHG